MDDRDRASALPRGREWVSLTVLAALIFLCDYGLLFWAEQRVPSGIAAVMLATIPAFMALSEIIFLRTQKLTAAACDGTADRDWRRGGADEPVAEFGRSADRSERRAGAARRVGHVVDCVGDCREADAGSGIEGGEFGDADVHRRSDADRGGRRRSGSLRDFIAAAVSHGVWWALIYLIVAGSIIGFTAYVWLLHHESPTKVGTYAYVNPVVAVMIGYFLGGEALDARIVLGAAFVLVSVIVITTSKATKPQAVSVVAAKDAAA